MQARTSTLDENACTRSRLTDTTNTHRHQTNCEDWGLRLAVTAEHGDPRTLFIFDCSAQLSSPPVCSTNDDQAHRPSCPNQSERAMPTGGHVDRQLPASAMPTGAIATYLLQCNPQPHCHIPLVAHQLRRAALRIPVTVSERVRMCMYVRMRAHMCAWHAWYRSSSAVSFADVPTRRVSKTLMRGAGSTSLALAWSCADEIRPVVLAAPAAGSRHSITASSRAASDGQ